MAVRAWESGIVATTIVKWVLARNHVAAHVVDDARRRLRMHGYTNVCRRAVSVAAGAQDAGREALPGAFLANALLVEMLRGTEKECGERLACQQWMSCIKNFEQQIGTMRSRTEF